jgi:hypothetical protein
VSRSEPAWSKPGRLMSPVASSKHGWPNRELQSVRAQPPLVCRGNHASNVLQSNRRSKSKDRWRRRIDPRSAKAGHGQRIPSSGACRVPYYQIHELITPFQQVSMVDFLLMETPLKSLSSWTVRCSQCVHTIHIAPVGKIWPTLTTIIT